MSGWWFVLTLTILKNMSSSMGLGWHPIYEMENKSHVPNHQPVLISSRTLAFDFAGNPLESIKHVGEIVDPSVSKYGETPWDPENTRHIQFGKSLEKYRFISTWRIIPRIGNCLDRDRLVIGFVPFSWAIAAIPSTGWTDELVTGDRDPEVTGVGLDAPIRKKHWAITRPKKTQ